jgi:hypothetical protein
MRQSLANLVSRFNKFRETPAEGPTQMGLNIIGSGFGRTGTMSTKMALEQLGFGPCHHMVEVMGNPGQPAHWKARAAGQEMDWAEVFHGYKAQVDFPGASVWHELSIAFPTAKVIHTERPEDEWWASYSATIGKFFEHRESLPLPPPVADVFETMDKLLIGGVSEVSTGSARSPPTGATTRWCARRSRQRGCSCSRPRTGGSLCAASSAVPFPRPPFPRSNAREEFWALFGGEPAVA